MRFRSFCHLTKGFIKVKRTPSLYRLGYMSLLIINVTFIQKSLASLDTAQYPLLSYKSEKINVSRDLFRARFTEKTISNPFKSAPQTIDAKSQVKPLCNKWSKTVVYLGFFSIAGEKVAIIQDLQLKTIKVKVGEFVAGQNLSLQKITQGKLKTINSDSSICWLNKLTY